ncbi:hypothetical protein [Leadbettera azotonutricia]|uniref:Uncharacterized protein n=1 Tax=Leadbettera azotonutricia (strain ATCC BAA-888 / DSM 13862 / ZAS-9) TaxID=545695 RepID=F5YB48_LEAAZ|nr:hypothetical protein [Leadbettera azotonutricia]AEF83246.1 hypothetical protein TREAZ_3021 [Leadbettera azotonutricia ZAS-9]
MPYSSKWLPGTREGQLEMARTWSTVLSSNAKAWSIPAAELTGLNSLVSASAKALDAATGEGRGPVNTAKCKAAFEALVGKMRFIKERYFFMPPLTDADRVSLGLKPKDTVRSPKGVPKGKFTGVPTRLSMGGVEFRIQSADDVPQDTPRVISGYSIHYGIMPNAPLAGEALPHEKFTRHKKERFEFSAEDRGKTVYFCIRAENSKGEAGPWGSIFQAIIP